MALVKLSASGGNKSTTSKSLARKAGETALLSSAKVLGAGLTLAGLGIGVHKLRKARAMSEGSFQKMIEFAGDEYKSLPKKDKELVRQYHKALATHSPTIARDPIASWNQIRQLIHHPGMYGPQTVGQLRDVEARIILPTKIFK